MVGEFQAKSFKSLVVEYRNGPLWGRTELSDTELDFSGKALYCAIQNWTSVGKLLQYLEPCTQRDTNTYEPNKYPASIHMTPI